MVGIQMVYIQMVAYRRFTDWLSNEHPTVVNGNLSDSLLHPYSSPNTLVMHIERNSHFNEFGIQCKIH